MPQEVPNRAEQDAPAAAERSGEDVRRRGWFWHWNTIITQYAPLIGLKGVGLLNSYTVWTDRRDESPHRGYAFPSQQSEADFYGEDRAELITINKILVALDLIEIRKEMVLRVDPQGRRWRVPHNLYRVKDHPQGYNLTIDDVLRVVELAARDRAVYRYIRRIFSSRFSPIDRDNIWHQLLPALRQNPTWQRLAAKAEREEARASARTKAGHASRARGNGAAESPEVPAGHSDDAPPAGQPSTQPGGAHDRQTSVANTNTGLDWPSSTDVARDNSGSAGDVAPTNDGLSAAEGSSDEQSNHAAGGIVEQSNTTYYQESSTTTTTTTGQDQGIVDRSDGGSGRPRHGAGPLLDPSAAVLACFEAANGRDASPLERELLAELEAAFDEAARATGATGGEWVAAAIREAVSSGSRFVAPKRIREILVRWAARQTDRVRPGSAPPTALAASPSAPDFPLPHGQGSHRTWEFVLRRLAQALDRVEMERLFSGSAIAGYEAGTVTVEVGSAEAALRLSAEYYDLVARKLSEAMRRPVRARFVAPGSGVVEDDPRPPDPPQARPAIEPPGHPQSPRFVLPGGLTNLQVWAIAQDELARRLTPANYEAWVRPAALIGIDDDGALVIGAPNTFAQRRLGGLLPEVRAVLSEVLARPVEARVVVAHDWLRSQRQDGQAERPSTENGA